MWDMDAVIVRKKGAIGEMADPPKDLDGHRGSSSFVATLKESESRGADGVGGLVFLLNGSRFRLPAMPDHRWASVQPGVSLRTLLFYPF